MRLLRHLPLLLCLLSPTAFADSNYQVELILFRQASTPLLSSQPVPDDWASDAQLPASGSERSTALNNEAAKLIPANGYEVLLHQAWQQSVGPTPVKIALSNGQEQLGQFPAQGTLSLKLESFVDVTADFWANQFDADGMVTASEHIKQSSRLKNGQATYLDHGSLGILIKVSPL
ncbi:MAG: peptidoglycan binding protein CsiV [Pseudomonadaceae bacterium]|nr:peptidoglycan binding protein CsiV [Pseudomonadaceae bacterium]